MANSLEETPRAARPRPKRAHSLSSVISKLHTLIDVNSIIVSSLDKNEVLKSILEQTKVLMDCEKSSVLLIDQAAERLYFEVVSNDAELETLRGIRLRKGEGIAGKVWASERIHVINEITAAAGHSKKVDLKLAETTRSLIAAPLVAKGKTIGVMEAINKRRNRPFDKFDQEIFTTLSHQAAIAIYNARLYEMAIRDGMTKLYIHTYFYERLHEEFNRSQRNRRDLAVIMFDLDRFKDFNDRHGHRLGDELLVRVASIIGKNCRASDLPARYGGEEFAIILPESDDRGAYSLAERVRRSVGRLRLAAGAEALTVTISAGVASLRAARPADGPALVDLADAALYHAKEAGRNRVVVYKSDMRRPKRGGDEPADRGEGPGRVRGGA
ncbi:MAG: sensor domain-containing diguanylate cyclase [Spirochaetales bacterium]|nr:sensor domain-containing diguanylate cyclase [Spirochaetales bacterium]